MHIAKWGGGGRQSELTTYYIIPTNWHLGNKANITDTVEKHWWLPGIPGKGRRYEQVGHGNFSGW